MNIVEIIVRQLDLLRSKRSRPEPVAVTACPASSYAKAQAAFAALVGRPAEPGEDAVGFIAELIGPVAEELRRLNAVRYGSAQAEFEASCASGR